MPISRRFRSRSAVMSGCALVLAIAVTGAASVISSDYRVDFVGSDNRFALTAAASADPAWHPSATDWEDAAEVPIELRLTVDGSQYELAPGDSVDMKLSLIHI